MDEKKCGNCGWDGVTPLDSGDPKMMESLEEPTEAVWGKQGQWTLYDKGETIPQDGEWDSKEDGCDTEMDDTMIRGCLVFYIDVGQLPPFKAEAYVERMKDQLNSKKAYPGSDVTMKYSSYQFATDSGTRVKYIAFH